LSSAPATYRHGPAASAAVAAGPRPEPALGVFETLLVADGRPRELDAHLARLDASLGVLFGAQCPHGARALVLDRASGAELARLRLTVAPADDGGPLAADVVVARVDAALVMPDWDRSVELAPLVVRGGIGAHKWADPRHHAGAEADVAPRVPLLLDGDGAVLEASRGNLFAVRDGALVTPPADGRILPGVTRDRVLRLAERLGLPAREEAIALDAMLEATEVFLTGAVRGIEPVRGCGAAVVASDERITPALSRELDLLWRGVGHARVG
jgi:para-aminobenzoate synthetase/4-amino-4-deoxychorismate lyase